MHLLEFFCIKEFFLLISFDFKGKNIIIFIIYSMLKLNNFEFGVRIDLY